MSLGVLAIGAGAAALSHTKKAQQAKADVNVVGEFTITRFQSRNVFGEANMNEMMFVYISGTDYPQVDGEDATTFNVDIADAKFEEVGFYDHVRLGDETTNHPYIGGQAQLNRFQRWPCFSIMPNNNGNFDKMTISKGALIPSYSYIMGGAASYYSLKFNYEFTVDNAAHLHTADTDVEWSVNGSVDEALIAGEFTIPELYTIRVFSGDPSNPNEMLMVKVDGTDYPDLDGAESDQQVIADAKFPFLSSHLVMGTSTVPSMLDGQNYLNFWTRHTYFTCCPLGIFNYNSLTVKKGLLIPTYTYIKGGAESYYRLATTYYATRVGTDATLNAENAWTLTGEPYYLGELSARTDGEGHLSGTLFAQDAGWDGNRVHCIFAIDDVAGWKWNSAKPTAYNIDASAYVDDDYTENILFDGKTLKQLNAEGKVYRLLKANSIGLSQFGVVFDSEDFSANVVELKAGTKIPAPDGIGYYLTKMHIIKNEPICGWFDAGRTNGLDDFVKNYMHMDDVPTSDPGTGKCTSEGWYVDAKAAFNALEGYEKASFTMIDTYSDAKARLAAWAAANGDVLDGWDLKPASSSQFIAKSLTQNNSAIIIVAVGTFVVLISAGLFFVLKKRKVER